MTLTTKQMEALVWVATHPGQRAHAIPGAYASSTVASLVKAGLVAATEHGVFLTDAGKTEIGAAATTWANMR